MNETKKNVKNECVKYIDILFIIKTNKCNDAEIKYSNFSNVSKSLKCLVSFFPHFISPAGIRAQIQYNHHQVYKYFICSEHILYNIYVFINDIYAIFTPYGRIIWKIKLLFIKYIK